MSNIFEFHTKFKATEVTSDQWKMACPFCGKDDHFYFNKEALWDCKVCGEKGNGYNFIEKIHIKICEASSLDTIRERKQLPRRVFEEQRVRWNPLNRTYVLPTYNTEGRMNQLYKYVLTNNTVYASPGLAGVTLYNWGEVTEDTIWLVEGHWDKLAGEAIIGVASHITVIGVPGANTFKDTWAGALRDKDVVLIYDKDEAGEKGIENVLNKLHEAPQKPRSIRRVQWPAEAKKGYDLRDFYLEHGRASLGKIEKLYEPVKDKEAVKVTSDNIEEDVTCDSYDKALESYQTAYHTTDDTKHALALVLASIWSIKFDGMEQLWLKVIGPPGCGKTRIAKAVSASDQVKSLSTFTGLFSGWKDNSDDDPGLIPMISGKTLIVKDADALLRQPNIEQIMSELRDFYDKDSSVTYRNRQQYSYKNVKSTFIMCGTQALRSADHSFLGERFMSIEMNVSNKDKATIAKKVMQRTVATAHGDIKDPETGIMSSMKGWINHLLSRELDTRVPEEMQDLIIDLANLTALMRTEVARDFRRKVTNPAVPELPSRIIGQTMVAAYSLGVVLGKNVADEEIFQIINKMIRDTINPRSIRFKVCMFLLENPDASFEDIMEQLGVTRNKLDDEIEDLTELRLLTPKKRSTGTAPGAKRYYFILSDELRSCLAELRAGATYE